MRLLVIGHSNFVGATKSLTWNGIATKRPVLADYDFAILDLSTFSHDDYIALNANNGLLDLRNKILEAITEAQTFIYCITTKEKHPYNIMPFLVDIRSEEEGDTFKNKATEPYFTNVKRWDYCFEQNARTLAGDFFGAFSWQTKPLAITPHNRLVAFTVQGIGRKGVGMGVIYFYPAQTGKNGEESVKNLIPLIQTSDLEETSLPTFLVNITVEGEEKIKTKFDEAEQQIVNGLKNKEEAGQKLQEINLRKGVLAFKGKSLEKSVRLIFEDMGLSIKGEEQYEEDGIFKFDESSIPVEIKGHDGNIKRADLAQLYTRVAKAEVPEEAKVKGVLIGNPFASTELDKRGEDFEHNIVKAAEGMEICLLGTRVLFEYWNSFRKLGKTDLGESILNKPGVLKFKEIKENKTAS